MLTLGGVDVYMKLVRAGMSSVFRFPEATVLSLVSSTKLLLWCSHRKFKEARQGVGVRNSSPCLGRNTVRFDKSAQKYPWVPKNVWSGVSGTGNSNMKSVLV